MRLCNKVVGFAMPYTVGQRTVNETARSSPSAICCGEVTLEHYFLHPSGFSSVSIIPPALHLYSFIPELT